MNRESRKSCLPTALEPNPLLTPLGSGEDGCQNREGAIRCGPLACFQGARLQGRSTADLICKVLTSPPNRPNRTPRQGILGASNAVTDRPEAPHRQC